MDALDILSEVLFRIGNILATTSLQKQTGSTLFALLGHSRKRAALAVGHLVVHLPDDIFDKILNGLETFKNTSDRLRTYIQVTGAIRYAASAGFGQLYVL